MSKNISINRMKKQFIAALLSLASLHAIAQGGPEKYAATITKEGLKQQLSVIAGDEMQGRETGPLPAVLCHRL
jgi:hypothetical protein